MQFGVQIRIPVATAIVIVDHVLQSTDCHRALWRRSGNLAQARSFEIALAGAEVGEPAAAPSDAGVVKTLVREVRADMAGHAIAPTPKELKAGLLFCVKGGMRSPLMKRSNRESPKRMDRTKLASAREIPSVGAPIRAAASHERQVHLVGIPYGLENLFFERSGTAVPEKEAAVTAIDERRRVAAALAAEDADGDGAPNAWRRVTSSSGLVPPISP